MIRINLLPEEHRRKSRSSFKVLGLIAAGAGANALLVAWYGWLAFGLANEVESESAVLQTELDGLTPQVTYNKSLEAEKLRFTGREQTLASITKTRISWTKKIDELVSVINSGGDGKRHFVWLDDMALVQHGDPKAKSAGSFRAAAHSGSEAFAQVANFLEDLEKSTFVEDFMPPAPPEGSQTQVDKELEPPVVWNFPLALQLKSKEPPKPDPRKAATKPAAEAGATEAKQ